MIACVRKAPGILAAMVLATGLGACTMAPGLTSKLGFGEKNYFSSAPTIPVESRPLGLSPVTASQPVGTPPAPTIAVLSLPYPVGQVKKVREKHYANGSRQEIILNSGPGVYGENLIEVSIQTSGGNSSGGAQYLEIGPPSEQGIRNEILSRFPDVRMNIVTRPMRNRFGPYGLAIGRHPNGARCIFVWQWLNDLREHTPGISNFAKFGAMLGNRAMKTSIRMRVCRTGVTVDQLAGYAEGLKVPARQPVERLATLKRNSFGSPVISQDGISRSPLLQPVGSSLESALTGGRTAAAKPVARKVVSRTAAAKPAPVRRAKRSAPRRSSARSYNRIRHYTDRGTPVAAPAATPAAPVAPGGKYLAPVANPPAAASGPLPGYRPKRGVGLPPEAYRGPRS